MPQEPTVKRAVSFFDGQNLFRHAKDAFGHHHPNYDPGKLAVAVCDANGWSETGVHFYTGVPEAEHSAMWHGYWTRRLTAMRRAGITVTSRRLRHRIERITLPDGTEYQAPVMREKGIDLRLGLDVVRMARNRELDVAVIFSQDQDLAEVAREIRDISRSQGRWLKIVSAFPDASGATARRGISGTDWFRMDRAFYDACLDTRDYRPPR
ncbi:MAG: NYN domain-containing protein [Gammaproteobacteria bacterium]|nr:NYN domain-containing protein [Gammaproteobacteria bacterium]